MDQGKKWYITSTHTPWLELDYKVPLPIKVVGENQPLLGSFFSATTLYYGRRSMNFWSCHGRTKIYISNASPLSTRQHYF